VNFRDAVIHVPLEAAPAERYAAEELQTHLRQMTGGLFSVRELPVTTAGPVILLGRSAVARLLAGFDWNALGEDGGTVKRVGHQLLLAGASPRGTLYAVYTFLDRVLGCRWYTPQCCRIPQRENLEIGDIDLVDVPSFQYRETFFACVGDDADWLARNRTNGHLTALDARHGGKWQYAGGTAGFAHTFFILVPPETYFAAHPEFYSEINGQRTYVSAQLCLTNEGLLAVVCDNIRQWLHENPAAQIVSLTQNDWDGWCQCHHCRSIDEAEGSPSGTMIHFVNRVAERLEPEFPRIFFDTFAYTYTVRPPKTLKPRHNVIVRLCQIGPCCDGHPLERCEQNREFVSWLQGWSAIAPHLFVWDYFNNFYHYFQPLPNIDALAADLRFYARQKVAGVFCQGDGFPPKGCGDMAELRAWLLARLLWDPRQDVWTLVDEFLQQYYGPAAPLLREYLDLLHERAREENIHFYLYSPLESPVVEGEMIPRCHAIFERAEAAVADKPVLLDRVRAARLPVDYIHWKRELRFVVSGDRYQPQTTGMADRLHRFLETAEAHGARALRERGLPLQQLKSLPGGYSIVTLQSDRLHLAIIPALGGRMTSLVDTTNGIDWLHQGLPEAMDYPWAGGYEEYTESRWRTPGWCEAYRVEMHTRNEVMLSASLENGFCLQRRYGLAGGTLHITSTISNPTDTSRAVCFRSAPEFATGDLETTTVEFALADGSWQAHAPWRNTGAQSESRWLEGDALPHGACRLIRNGHWLTLHFDRQQIEKVLFDWDRSLNLIRLGLNSPGIILGPGEAIVIKQEWSTVRPPAAPTRKRHP